MSLVDISRHDFYEIEQAEIGQERSVACILQIERLLGFDALTHQVGSMK